jgi:Ran-binding protein 9/10
VKHFPTVALHSPGEAVSVNFGASPFRFDLNALIQDERDRSLASVRAQSLDLATVR